MSNIDGGTDVSLLQEQTGALGSSKSADDPVHLHQM